MDYVDSDEFLFLHSCKMCADYAVLHWTVVKLPGFKVVLNIDASTDGSYIQII